MHDRWKKSLQTLLFLSVLTANNAIAEYIQPGGTIEIDITVIPSTCIVDQNKSISLGQTGTTELTTLLFEDPSLTSPFFLIPLKSCSRNSTIQLELDGQEDKNSQGNLAITQGNDTAEGIALAIRIGDVETTDRDTSSLATMPHYKAPFLLQADQNGDTGFKIAATLIKTKEKVKIGEFDASLTYTLSYQ